MKTVKYLITGILLPLGMLCSCYSDSAENPKFSDTDVPRILGDWVADLVYNLDDVLEMDPVVSPSDGATYKWTINGNVISTEKKVTYTFTEPGEYTLRFEVDRYGTINSRTATIIVAKPFEAKTYQYKSVGYLTINGSASDVVWDNITHLIVSSSLVDGQPNAVPDGEELPAILQPAGLSSLLTTAHNNGVYVLLQYSGVITHLTAAPTYGSYTFLNSLGVANRAALISNMIDFAVDNGFDGIDIYMDKAHDGAFTAGQTANVEAFITELTAAVPDETERGDFFLTSTLVVGWTRDAQAPFVTAAGSDRFDWYNIAAFAAEDLTPGPHSSMWGLMEPNVSHWITTYSVDKARLVPLAPAFGLRYFGTVGDYTWGNLYLYTEYIPYKTVCATYAGAENTNQQAVDNGLFYDGLADVKQKAEYAAGQAWGGMGLWSVENDVADPAKSLMKQINTSLGN